MDQQADGPREGMGVSDPGAHCISRLGRRRDDLRRLLDGRSLSVQLDYASGRVVRVMMTPEGRVVAATGAHFEPHVLVKGDDEKIEAFLLGETRLLDAITDRLVSFGTRMVADDDIPSYRAVWAVVTEEERAARS